MAKAKQIAEVTEVVVKQEAIITLELTKDEAMFLYRLMGNHIVGGGVMRAMSNNIHYALSELEGFSVSKCTRLMTKRGEDFLRLASEGV